MRKIVGCYFLSRDISNIPIPNRLKNSDGDSILSDYLDSNLRPKLEFLLPLTF